MIDGITFSETKGIPADKLHALFLREQWMDYLDLEEVAHYIGISLHIASAWHNDELIGIARLGGDGRLCAELTDVLVKSEFQGKGIGTELARRATEEIRRLDPYKAWVEPMGEREIHIYGKLGFGEVDDYRIMEMNSPRLTEKIAEVRGRLNAAVEQ